MRFRVDKRFGEWVVLKIRDDGWGTVVDRFPEHAFALRFACHMARQQCAR